MAVISFNVGNIVSSVGNRNNSIDCDLARVNNTAERLTMKRRKNNCISILLSYSIITFRDIELFSSYWKLNDYLKDD